MKKFFLLLFTAALCLTLIGCSTKYGGFDRPLPPQFGDNTEDKNDDVTPPPSGGAEATPRPTPPPVDYDTQLTCTLTIRCDTVLVPDNWKDLKKNKRGIIPADGIMGNKSVKFDKLQVIFYSGESVFDVLLRETKSNGIQMEHRFTPIYDSHYIVGIANLYEFDCGQLSGWMYFVNGKCPNYGCSQYYLKDGDSIQWLYTCDLGRDLGSQIS